MTLLFFPLLPPTPRLNLARLSSLELQSLDRRLFRHLALSPVKARGRAGMSRYRFCNQIKLKMSPDCISRGFFCFFFAFPHKMYDSRDFTGHQTHLCVNLLSKSSYLYKARSSADQNKWVPKESIDEPRSGAPDVWEGAVSCLMRHSPGKEKKKAG